MLMLMMMIMERDKVMKKMKINMKISDDGRWVMRR